MDSERLGTRMAHGVIAFAIATVGAIIVTILVTYVSIPIFGFHLRHAGRSDPRLLLFALIMLPVAWGVLFWQTMRWQRVWELRREHAELAEDLKERFTITGRAAK